MTITPPQTDIHETVAQVESSPEFLHFTTTHPEHYLVHAFATNPAPVELGYYLHDAQKIVVFKTVPIQMLPPEEVFTSGGKDLEALDLTSVRIGMREALQIASNVCNEEYAAQTILRTIVILQQQDRPVWNMTLVTNTLNMINMKLDGTTGQILTRELQNIMSLAKDV